MSNKSFRLDALKLWIAVLLACAPAAALADGPKTPQEFAASYMDAFNKGDAAALHKLQYPVVGKSPLQETIDSMTEADMSAGTKYSTFELLPVDAKKVEPSLGPDGIFYKPNLQPTNMLKLSSQTKDGSSSLSFPIGQKDGIFYAVAAVPEEATTPDYKFGWQRFNAPKSNWSVLFPNEPEPGVAALERQLGKDALQDPDVYGAIKNTAEIKTCQHYFIAGTAGKRWHADDNHETYRAECTTYAPETLKEWFADPKKTLDDIVAQRTRTLAGKLIQQEAIKFSEAPGRAFEIRGEDGTVLLDRVYWINNALFELSYQCQKQKPDTVSAQKFLNSLEVK